MKKKIYVVRSRMARAVAIGLATVLTVAGTPASVLAEELEYEEGYEYLSEDGEIEEIREEGSEGDIVYEDQGEEYTFGADDLHSDGVVQEEEEERLQPDKDNLTFNHGNFRYKIEEEYNKVALIGISTDLNDDYNITGTSETPIEIPYEFTHNGTTYFVKRIADHAFDCIAEEGYDHNVYWTNKENRLQGPLKLNNGLERIGVGAFRGCSRLIGKLTLPNSVEWIENYAFYDCKGFTGLALPDPEGFAPVNICAEAFKGCSNMTGSLKITAAVPGIGQSIFSGCVKFGSLQILQSNRSYDKKEIIEIDAFSDCTGLDGKVDIPDGIKTIKKGAFKNCSNIDEFEIPSSVDNIVAGAFSGCTSVGKIRNDSNCTISASEFLNNTDYCYKQSGSGKVIKQNGTLGNGYYIKEAYIPVTEVIIEPQLEVAVGQKTSLGPWIKPDNASIQTVEWSIEDESIATVDSEGNVKGVKEGNTILTATVDGVSAQCPVTVTRRPVEGVTLSPGSGEVKVGKTITLKARIVPSDASDQRVSWKSSDPSIATVSDGKVKGIKPGIATITVTTKEGGYIAACIVTVSPVKVTGVTVSPTSGELFIGKSLTLKATVSPADATDKKVIWKSSNDSIATVVNGKVTALKPGTVDITAKTEDGGFTAECKIKVNGVDVTGVSLDRTSGTVYVGSSLKLNATVTPADATNKKVIWKSSNESIATVENGKVTALKPGTVDITVKTLDGGKTATCTVKVKPVDVKEIKLDKTSANIAVGKSIKLNATVLPDNATFKNIIWKSSNTKVAVVEDGKVAALKKGSATITATSGDKKVKVNCKIIVSEKVVYVKGIKLNKKKAEVVKGKTLKLNATVSPGNATNKKVTWKSSDTSIAKVSADGTVKGIKKGKVKITCTATDGSKKSATCEVTVKNPPARKVTGITLNKKSVTLGKGKTFKLTAKISPKDATNKKVTWKSSKKSVATVSENGVVKGLKKGTATITCTAADGSKKSATCTITVK